MRRLLPFVALGALACALLAGTGDAQIEGGSKGAAPVDSSGAYEISGINVDVAAANAQEARYGGWRIAQRKAWAQLAARLGRGGNVSDGTLDALSAGIVIENEQISPTRYIARLGVLFDRERTGALLGLVDDTNHSPPMLVVPVQYSGGVGQVFEGKSDWQAAWARYRTGNSSIDYIRLAGTGPDSLLLNAGQTGRPGRGWWRTVLSEYSAQDVLIPTVRLYHQWPGGPVVGVFQARHGPDDQLVGSFSLRVTSAAGLPALLDAGVKRMDDLYAAAQRGGFLTRDPTLSPPPVVAPLPLATDLGPLTPSESLDQLVAESTAGVGITVSLQFDTPSSNSVAATETAVRGISGVRSARTTSLALGGTSVMRVTYDGDPDTLRLALQSRGYQVFGAGVSLRIRRAPQLLPPDLAADNATG